jgi:hypothetical protein
LEALLPAGSTFASARGLMHAAEATCFSLGDADLLATRGAPGKGAHTVIWAASLEFGPDARLRSIRVTRSPSHPGWRDGD